MCGVLFFYFSDHIVRVNFLFFPIYACCRYSRRHGLTSALTLPWFLPHSKNIVVVFPAHFLSFLFVLFLHCPLTPHTHSLPPTRARSRAQIYLDFEVFAVLKIQEQRRIASQKVEVDSPLFVNAFRAWQQVRACTRAHTRVLF